MQKKPFHIVSSETCSGSSITGSLKIYQPFLEEGIPLYRIDKLATDCSFKTKSPSYL